ncbi:MAG: hypothetical protein F2567_04095 [Actinobacteria bacterium]|uniref:Unannotated protein n=1 Tax=freshwater metagenome TaxID=449393 RepID=A0A6J5ZJP6_9ZZZZ|nr:hypothetical protein [Actinomycetota bacterium]MTA42202.1 hypothetical protein [Actinomycetota bacterium]
MSVSNRLFQVRRILRSHVAVAFACACWAGAFVRLPLPMWLGITALLTGVLSRRPALIVLAGLLASSVFSFNAHAGLTSLAAQPWRGSLTLVSDPQMFPGRVVAVADTDLGRVQLTASSSVAVELRRASAGSAFIVSGTLRPLAHSERLASRHVRMSLMAITVEPQSERSLWRLPVDVVRGLVLEGSEGLPLQQRPIYRGFVIGDDRGSDPVITQSFEDSGLAHLLVVSGENVVFVIAVTTPLLVRLPRRTRAGVTVGILLLFAAVTRFEPSILRATAMALIAVLGTTRGRPIDARLRLAAAVSFLVLIDPLLVESFGFQLSIAATAGIACLSQPLMKLLWGPGWFRQVVAVTVAAQIAVAPLIIPTFGPMPLASLPANVLAEPIAGFVMMWGSSIGLVAGLFGGWAATVVLAPVRVGLWWILNVAKWCAALSLPRLNLWSVAVLFVVGSLLFRWRTTRRMRSVEHQPRSSAG